MADTYSLFLTEQTEQSPHPIEYEPIAGGLEHDAAFGICMNLNQGGIRGEGFLRAGVEAHMVAEESE